MNCSPLIVSVAPPRMGGQNAAMVQLYEMKKKNEEKGMEVELVGSNDSQC